MHPYKPAVLHVDLQRISATESCTCASRCISPAPIRLPGVKQDGGIVAHLMTEMDITCLPKDLPEFLTVDLSHLALNQSVHLSDIKLPEGVTITSRVHGGGDLAVATIKIVHEEVIEAPVVAAPVEGEAAAAAPGAAAPAAGAAAPAAVPMPRRVRRNGRRRCTSGGCRCQEGCAGEEAEKGRQVRPSGFRPHGAGDLTSRRPGRPGRQYGNPAQRRIPFSGRPARRYRRVAQATESRFHGEVGRFAVAGRDLSGCSSPWPL